MAENDNQNNVDKKIAATDEELKKAAKEEERRLKEAEKEEQRKIKEEQRKIREAEKEEQRKIRDAEKEEQRKIRDAEKEEQRKLREAEREKQRKIRDEERAEKEELRKQRNAEKEELRKVRDAEKEEQRKVRDAEKEEQRKIKETAKEEQLKIKSAEKEERDKLKAEKKAEREQLKEENNSLQAGAEADGEHQKEGVWKNIVERMNSVSEGDDELGRDIEDETSDEIFFSPEEKQRKRKLGLVKLYLTLGAIAAIAIIIAFFTVRNNSFSHIYGQGVKAYNEENYDSAIDTFEKLSMTEEGAHNIDVLDYLAKSYIKNERYQDAIDVYNRALQSDPTFGPAITGLCEMYTTIKDGRALNETLDKYRGSNMEEYIADYMVSNPVTDPDAGKFEEDLEVTITGDESVPIFYTLDGSDPNEQSPIYSTPIKVSEGTTQIKAISINTLGIRSGIIDKSYTVEYRIPNEPKIALNSGIYVTGQTVTISGDEGCDIFYTTDGSAPTRFSNKYTGPLRLVKGNVILTAISISNHGKESTTASKNYIIVQNAKELEEVEKMNNPSAEGSENGEETGNQNPNETDAQNTDGSDEEAEENSENEGLFDWLLNDRDDRRNR